MGIKRLVSLVVIAVLAGASAARQQNTQSIDSNSGTAGVSFSYKFEGPRFYIRVIEIEVSSNGSGELRFTRGESDEVLDCKLKLLPATITRIGALFEASGFFDSDTEYQ